MGWKDLNPRITESESAALPLGDTPVYFVFAVSLSQLLYYSTGRNICQPLFSKKSDFFEKSLDITELRGFLSVTISILPSFLTNIHRYSKII